LLRFYGRAYNANKLTVHKHYLFDEATRVHYVTVAELKENVTGFLCSHYTSDVH